MRGYSGNLTMRKVSEKGGRGLGRDMPSVATSLWLESPKFLLKKYEFCLLNRCTCMLNAHLFLLEISVFTAQE